MHIAVDGNNFFHTGWLAAFLNLPMQHPSADSLKSGDVAAFREGWQMCADTPPALRYEALPKMMSLGQVAVRWCPED